MTKHKTHVPEMDYLRAFAILAVLAIHVSAGFRQIPNINALMVVNVGIYVLSYVAVPLFILISGFLLYMKYNKDYSLKEFYLKRFWRVIPPYLVFTTFYLACTTVFKSFFNEGVFSLTLPSVIKVIYAYFAAGGYYHLWFFLIIIELYLFYPLIVKIYHFFANKGAGILFLVLALALQLGWEIFGANFQIHLFGYSLTITTKIFLCRVFYFALGIYLCNHYSSIKEWVLNKSIWTFIIPTVICTIITSATWLIGIATYGSYSEIPKISLKFYGSLLLPVFYLFTFAFLFSLSNKIVNAKAKMERGEKTKASGFTKHIFSWLSIISLYSFGIYLIHPFFQQGVTYALKIIGITCESVVYYPLEFCAILLMSIVFVYIARKFPFHKYVIG